QQPPSQRQQNKGADRGLQEEAERGTRPLSINRTMLERVSSFMFLGVHINEDLAWTHHTDFHHKDIQTAALLSQQAAEAQHGLKDPDWLHHRLLCSSCTALNCKALQRVVKAAQHITRTELPPMEDFYTQQYQASFSFLEKEDKNLSPCIDNCGLSDITVKN
ncbi:hypothetical protein L3Q82_017133, partial [Scortum barcoo]